MTAFRRKGQPRVGRAQEVKERYTYPSRPQESTVLAMNPQVSAESESFYRKAGWAAITSGVIGIVAYGLLMTAVKTRTGWIDERAFLFFKAHDIGTIFQFLLLAIVPLGLQKLSRKTPPGMSKATLAAGVGAILFVALLLLLGIARIVSDGFYMFPQGVFGVWLIVISWRLLGSLPRWHRWFGMVVGLGLTLVGIAWLGVAFVYPSMLAIPAVPLQNVVEQNTLANNIFHHILYVGSYMGVATLPIWTILTGLKLLREKRLDEHATLQEHTALQEL